VTAHRPPLRTRGARGQSLVEFALIAPLLIVLIVGSAQLAAILYGGITVASAAHDAAKVASEQPINSAAYQTGGTPAATFTDCPSASNPVCNAVVQSEGLLSSAQTRIFPGTAGGTGTACPTGSVPDGYVTVKVSDDVPIFVPFLNNLLANSPGATVRTIATTVTMRVEPCSMTNKR
jgi:Flp pilus assembly protein TadG